MKIFLVGLLSLLLAHCAIAQNAGGAVASTGSTGLETSHVLKAAPARLYSITIYNSGSAQFVLFFNAVAVPADTAVPDFAPIPIAAASVTMIRFEPPVFFPVGLSVSNSSTGTAKAVGSANCWFSAQVQ